MNQNEQKQKKSYIYNNTPDTQVPAGYDGNVLDFDNTNLINVQQKSKMGTYSNRIVLFDPFNTFYEVKKNKADDENVKTSGKKLPVFNPEFDIDYTRTSYFVLDTGTFPEGDVSQQLEKSQDQNFSHGEIVNQSFMRYNQFFSSQVSITIPGDFELHAGDLIFVDAPQLNIEKSDEVDRQSGGLYIISDLCHYITPKEFRTELTLVRDSFEEREITLPLSNGKLQWQKNEQSNNTLVKIIKFWKIQIFHLSVVVILKMNSLILRDMLRNMRKILKQATIMIQQILKCFVMKNLGQLSVSYMRINI